MQKRGRANDDAKGVCLEGFDDDADDDDNDDDDGHGICKGVSC